MSIVISQGRFKLSYTTEKNEKQPEAQPTRRGVSVYAKNPFMMEITTKTRRITNKRGDMMLVSSETGEIQSSIAGFWEGEEVDATKFVKLFVRGVKALKELTGAGTKVFEVLYLRVQENIGKDRVFMALAEVDQTLTPMSPATYKRGMAELIEKGFIAATPTQGWYWLNPDFVWNGDRLAFVKEYKLKRSKTDEDFRKELETDLPSVKAMDVLKRAVDTYETIEGQPTTAMDVLKKALSDQEILEQRGQQRLDVDV